ncbi:MAG: nif-specific transcriptional activator NifA [Acidithiobacillus ferriphilus]|jgi:Nif-specific regulatory protein|uniref:nif-specific transcriptional activator NifA n=1 Tax=Acidithiobacillus ferriphilus TaxID=1689834 RepID=UPI00242AD122|nr:nif-specific transcriptional activator NifA [Acidithiobacillus ferriphilus]MBW9249548.1 nif-specific transcriptional activator NifA [Acidithiobacillus ferriphilus]MBW9254704.1 nif-specific transcriptional activator NifA [Acidithiobacillus ferriphilus]
MKDHVTPNHFQELTTIYEVSKVLSSSMDLEHTLNDVLKTLESHLHISPSMILLRMDENLVGVIAATGLSAAEMERGRYRLGEGMVGKIMRAGMPVVIPDVSQEPAFLHRAYEPEINQRLHAFVGVPIKVGYECIGVLAIYRSERHKGVSFRSDVRLLQMIANLVGQTVNLHQGISAERNRLLQEKHRLQKELQKRYSIKNVIGHSRAMQSVFADVHQAAPGKATVLLRGESGTGKEVIARAIHYLSPRRDKAFVSLNCAALPESILESELFGHERGAFTGATQERKGRFELADGGTLFLDEIGDISPAFQAKLLRVLQEREFERVGGTQTRRVDVRIITATNRNLEEAVSKGEFRADLYYRINVVSIFLPPLRERREDIPALIEHFLARYNADNQRELTLTPEALQTMVSCYWPGNVRELENCVERTATMMRGDIIHNLDVPCQRNQCLSMALRPLEGSHPIITMKVSDSNNMSPPIMPEPARHVVAASVANGEENTAPLSERDRLIQAMDRCGWVQAKAARLLGTTTRKLGYALNKHGVEVKKL